MPIKAKPAVATEVLAVRVHKDTLELLDGYCRFLGGASDRTYVVGEALRLVIARDRRYSKARSKAGNSTTTNSTSTRATS